MEASAGSWTIYLSLAVHLLEIPEKKAARADGPLRLYIFQELSVATRTPAPRGPWVGWSLLDRELEVQRIRASNTLPEPVDVCTDDLVHGAHSRGIHNDH